jgi:hypothetical protein
MTNNKVKDWKEFEELKNLPELVELNFLGSWRASSSTPHPVRLPLSPLLLTAITARRLAVFFFCSFTFSCFCSSRLTRSFGRHLRASLQFGSLADVNNNLIVATNKQTKNKNKKTIPRQSARTEAQRGRQLGCTGPAAIAQSEEDGR